MAYKRKRKRSLINADTFGRIFSASVVVALLAIAFTDFGSQIKALIGQKSGCDIKGNIGPTGERIYHVPGDPWYAKTQISRHKGEKWFCSESDARAAGWRRSRR